MTKEIPFKQWRCEEAQRLGITEHGVFERYKRGKYPHLKLRKVTSKMIFVQPPQPHET